MSANLDFSGEKGVSLAEILAMATRAEGPGAERIRSKVPTVWKPQHDKPFTPDPRTLVPKPSHFKVLLVDDDFTAARFVFHELQRHFHKSRSEAKALTLEVHKAGFAVAGIFPYEVADHKAGLVRADARQAGFPFQAKLERV